MTPGIAYIDMEFAGIYGTHQAMQIPTEIGVVIHQPEKEVLSFAGKAFNRDVDVELWKNITDDMGKRIEGQRRVFNLASPGHTKMFDKTFHLNSGDRTKTRRAIAAVHRDLRGFMKALNQRDITTLVFFSRRREMDAFMHSRIKTDGFFIRDLQDEIRSCFHLRDHVSLDRVSLIARFRITRSGICSSHFVYTLPEKFRYLIKPHKAIGDAARIFLADLEFHRHREEFGERLTAHIVEYERRKMSEKRQDPENGQF